MYSLHILLSRLNAVELLRYYFEILHSSTHDSEQKEAIHQTVCITVSGDLFAATPFGKGGRQDYSAIICSGFTIPPGIKRRSRFNRPNQQTIGPSSPRRPESPLSPFGPLMPGAPYANSITAISSSSSSSSNVIINSHYSHH